MPDIPDGPGKELATLIRDARTAKGLTQEALEALSGVSRQTINTYERGRALEPRADTVRQLLLALGVDPREGPVALGFLSRDEANLPAERILLDPVLADVHQMVNNDSIPKRHRENLLRAVKAAFDVWVDMARIPASKEPGGPRHRARAVPPPGR